MHIEGIVLLVLAKHGLHSSPENQKGETLEASETEPFSSREDQREQASSTEEAAPSLDDQELIRVRKKRKKHGKALKIILIVLAAIVVLCIGVGIAIAAYMGSLSDSMKLDSEQQTELNSVLSESSAQEPFYILLLGSDARDADTASRSDTMILVRVDAKMLM